MVSTPLSVGPLSPEPGVGPAFQEQKACLVSSWNRLWADVTLQCAHHVEAGLAGGTDGIWHPGCVSFITSGGEAVAVCFRDGQSRLSLDRNVAEETEGKEKTSGMKPHFP